MNPECTPATRRLFRIGAAYNFVIAAWGFACPRAFLETAFGAESAGVVLPSAAAAFFFYFALNMVLGAGVVYWLVGERPVSLRTIGLLAAAEKTLVFLAVSWLYFVRDDCSLAAWLGGTGDLIFGVLFWSCLWPRRAA